MAAYERFAEAYRQTIAASLEVGERLTDADWAAPTECPLWSVGDVYAHLASAERWMAGGHKNVPPPDGFQDWVDAGVLAHRGRPPVEVLAELREVYAERLEQLAGPADPRSPATFPWGGSTDLEGLLRVRVFDCWTHEQDIRRATGHPGNLGSPAAQVSAEIILGSLPRIVAKATGGAPGSTVRLVTTGDVPLDVTIRVDDTGRAAVVPPDGAPPTTELRMTWEAYARLSGGRGEHDVEVDGDHTVAEGVLARLTVTP